MFPCGRQCPGFCLPSCRVGSGLRRFSLGGRAGRLRSAAPGSWRQVAFTRSHFRRLLPPSLDWQTHAGRLWFSATGTGGRVGKRKHCGLGRRAFSLLLELRLPARVHRLSSGLRGLAGGHGDLLAPGAGWPVANHPSARSRTSSPHATGGRPQTDQPSLLPYLAYLDIYFLRFSLKRSEAMLVLEPRADASGSRERESEVEHTHCDAKALGFLADHSVNPQGLVK